MDEQWAPRSPFPPSAYELARYLAARFYYPTDEVLEVAPVAQYVELTVGRRALYQELRKILGIEIQPTAVHQLLARLPLPVIFDTTYDDALERALREVNRPFDVLTYIADGLEAHRFRHDRPDGKSTFIDDPASYTGLEPRERLVVVKLNGRVDLRDQAFDSFVITEDDLIEAALRRTSALPVAALAVAASSSFLFLGSSLKDWSLRALLKEIRRDPAGRFKSWAVMRSPASLDIEYWHQQGVEVLDIGLDEYAYGLARTYGEFQVVRM
jgi:hypothetical protein